MYWYEGTLTPFSLIDFFSIGFSRVHSSVAPTVEVLNCRHCESLTKPISFVSGLKTHMFQSGAFAMAEK